jgi:hypothetical protein
MVKIKLFEKKKRLPKETQKGRRRRKVNEDKPQGKFNSHHVTSQEDCIVLQRSQCLYYI